MTSIDKQPPLPPMPSDSVVEDLSFTGTVTNIEAGKVYSRCVFDGVRWSSVDIREVRFIACRFVDNVFEASTVAGCLFQDVEFAGQVEFHRCLLDGNVFSDVLLGQMRCEASEWVANNGHQLAGEKWQAIGSVFAMNSWSRSQFQSLSWENCHLRDESFSEMQSGLLLCSTTRLQRVIFAGVLAESVEAKHCAGELVRFFKSKLQTVALRSMEVSQWAMADCDINAMSVLEGAMPLLQLQQTRVHRLEFNNVPLSGVLFDGSRADHLDMLMVTLKGGSLRQACVDRLKVAHCAWAHVDAKGFQLGLLESRNFRVENSDFSGLDKRQWGGVDFRKTEFELAMSFEEKQWWQAFRQATPDFVS